MCGHVCHPPHSLTPNRLDTGDKMKCTVTLNQMTDLSESLLGVTESFKQIMGWFFSLSSAVLMSQTGTWLLMVLHLHMNVGKQLWFCPSPCSTSPQPSSLLSVLDVWLPLWCHQQTPVCLLQLLSSPQTSTRASWGLRWKTALINSICYITQKQNIPETVIYSMSS